LRTGVRPRRLQGGSAPAGRRCLARPAVRSFARGVESDNYLPAAAGKKAWHRVPVALFGMPMAIISPAAPQADWAMAPVIAAPAACGGCPMGGPPLDPRLTLWFDVPGAGQ
jgi:hypothetical protein